MDFYCYITEFSIFKYLFYVSKIKDKYDFILFLFFFIAQVNNTAL